MADKMFVFEVEKINNKGELDKEMIFVDNPLAGSFKVSNGKITAYVYMDNDEVEVFVVDYKKNKLKKVEVKL